MNILVSNSPNVNFNGAKKKALGYINSKASKCSNMQDFFHVKKNFNLTYDKLLKCEDLENIRLTKKKLDFWAKFPGANKKKFFDFTYDRYAADCIELDKNASMQQMLDRSISLLRSLVKQKEIDSKTCFNFIEEHSKYEKSLYKKLIDRCIADIDSAIAKQEPEEHVDKLTSTLELFLRKFGYLDK